MNIVFVSHTAFHPAMVVGSHQLSRVYARAGHRVLHLSLPFSVAHLSRLGKPQMGSRLQTAWGGPREREPNLFEWVPLSLIPWDAAKFLLQPCRINLTVPLRRRIVGTLRKIGMTSVDIALIDDSRMCGIEAALNADRTVYRATDLYAQYRNDARIIEAEKRLLGNVQGVFATSERVAQHLREITNGCRVDVFANGFDAEHFRQQRDPHSSLRSIQRPRIVYVGAIDHRFDIDSVIGLAQQRPDAQILLYGPLTQPMPADVPENLRLLGSLEYESLPAVLQHCEVAILPLRDLAENHGRSPMKYYEYRAAGAAIAAFETESLRPLRTQDGLFLYASPTPGGLVAAVDAALEHVRDHPRVAAGERDLAQSWECIGQRMLDRIAQLKPAGQSPTG